MKYIKIEKQNIIDYSIEQLLSDHPDAVIYKNSKMPNEKLLSNYNVYPLITTQIPDLLEDEIAEEGIPEFYMGEWHQTWKIRKLTEEEIEQFIRDTPDITTENTTITDYSISFYAPAEIQEARYDICKSCPSFSILKTCKECGCIMPLKTKINGSNCPIGKW